MDGGTGQHDSHGFGLHEVTGFGQGTGESLRYCVKQVAPVGERACNQRGADFFVCTDGRFGRWCELAGRSERGALFVAEAAPDF